MANILNAVFHHYQAVNPAAPRETGILFGIYAAFPQNVGMHHATAQKLYPAGVTTNVTAFLFAKRTGKCELKPRPGKWEIKRLGLNFQLLAIVFFQEYF